MSLDEAKFSRNSKAKCEQADGYSGGIYHRFLKRLKNRIERRRAKKNPECIPGYKFYNGYEL